METAPFKVPLRLPLIPFTWQRKINASWEDDRAAVYKMVDGEGNDTPITFQYDRRTTPVFKTGYAIAKTGLVFDTWQDLHDYWPTYLENVVQAADKALKNACACDKEENDIPRT